MTIFLKDRKYDDDDVIMILIGVSMILFHSILFHLISYFLCSQDLRTSNAEHFAKTLVGKLFITHEY